jgi:hypothetical protein
VASKAMLNLVFDNGRDQRHQWARQPMILAARLITVTQEYRVRIRDLSAGGARIQGEELPEAGTDVLLKRGEFETFGSIAWVHDGQAGIAFDDPLDDAEVLALQKAPIHTPTPMAEDYRRPGFGRKSDGHPRWSDGTGWIDG